jgi:serine/threonine protein kinase
MPALLMMEFCENGTLEDYLAECVTEDMDTAVQLTFSADICRGLEYLTNRRVVHRDIAARNVLLDSTLTCKVSDFGMSTVLPHGEQFITLHEPIPVRWAGPEVLLEEKFSVMSDVFSFGVLMFEIFSYAKTPYTDIEDVNEVAKFVREGGHCARPDNCPAEIYNKLVMPCFEVKPEDRPTFQEIHDIAIDLGGIDEAHDAGMKADHLRNTASTMAETLTSEEKLKLLGPSVHHLNTGFRDGVLASMTANLGNVFVDYEKKVPVKSANDATIRHMVGVLLCGYAVVFVRRVYVCCGFACL